MGVVIISATLGYVAKHGCCWCAVSAVPGMDVDSFLTQDAMPAHTLQCDRCTPTRDARGVATWMFTVS
eukprot:8924504-Karenia_brevis.AAC.1